MTELPRSPELSLSELPARLELPALGVNLIAFGSLASALLGPSTFGFAGPAAAALIAAAWLGRGDLPGFWRRARFADTFTMGRGLVAIAATISLARQVSDAVLLAGPLMLVLVIVAGEPVARRLGELAVPYASGLPGVRTYERPWVSAGTLAMADWLALIALVVLAVVGGPIAATGGAASPANLAAGLAVLVLLACVADSVFRIQARRTFQRRLPAILEQFQPAFLLHWSAPSESTYQVEMWLPYLQRVGRPFFIVVRTSTGFEAVRRITDLPIVLRQTPSSMDALMVPSLKVACYVNSATINGHLVRYSQLTHIQLNHGDSDKGPSYSPVFRMFDKDFVAGQAAIDRFAQNGVDVPADMFVIVGRPQVESIAQASGPINQVTQPTVLYAPTWSGFHGDADYSSLPVGEAIIEALVARGCNVIFRPHPYARRSAVNAAAIERITARLAADAAATNRRHVWGPKAERDMSINDCFNASDAMIADVSSVVNDYLYSLKPFAMVAVTEPAQTFTAAFPIARAGYTIDASTGQAHGVEEALTELLDADSRADLRRKLKAYYLGDFPAEGYAQHFVDALNSFLSPPLAHKGIGLIGYPPAER
ncbi:MAG: CDP-glycerol glycerophosphotransferase family protein [Bifidobacteriaceae bacterium]|nr:CDP-glycerol glycerophosphotransferase family protein [Bifidobacteriaceae bacterium]